MATARPWHLRQVVQLGGAIIVTSRGTSNDSVPNVELEDEVEVQAQVPEEPHGSTATADHRQDEAGVLLPQVSRGPERLLLEPCLSSLHSCKIRIFNLGSTRIRISRTAARWPYL